MFNKLKIGVVIPALNEELAIYQVVDEIANLKHLNMKLIDEIIVCDNGSRDATANLAERAGARVVTEEKKGYGRACLAALAHLKEANVIVFVDGDGSILASDIIQLIQKINEGYDLVLGVRDSNLAERGSLFLHQKFGNFLIVLLIRLMWGTPFKDIGPLRAITASALQALDMKDKSYGWTLEMQIKTILRKLKVYEIPIHYRKRIGKSKISGSVKGSVLTMFKMLSLLLVTYVNNFFNKK